VIDVVRSPFPHTIMDGFWDEELLEGVLMEFPEPDADGWKRYRNNEELKLEGPPEMWGPRTYELFGRMGKLSDALADAFKTPHLILRPIGGGYHLIPPGGKLALHADFNRSEDQLYRRLNVLVYLNDKWKEEDGGHVELVGPDEHLRILPTFNRMLIFETSDKSFHGHPVPLPGPRSRRSFAAYFFCAEPPPGYTHDHSTVWYPGG
jgi:hypothetical protein